MSLWSDKMSNPYEMDMDVDDETGEVILPPGYTGRSSAPFGLRARSIGQVDQRMVRGPLAPAAQPAPSAAPATNTRTVTRAPATVLTPADCPACPPCPSAAPGRMRAPEGSLLGLVIGLGLVGSVLWYSGKMATEMAEVEEDLDEFIASLPPGAPKMLAANVAGSDEEE
jgi:hypothetical protein